MKIKIRQGLFETNSSTMHSIVITKEYCSLPYDEDFIYKCDVKTGKEDKTVIALKWASDFYFGRAPFKILSSVHQKTCYAFNSMYQGEYLKEEIKNNIQFIEAKKTLLEAIQEKLPDIRDIIFPEEEKTFYLTSDGNLLEYFPNDDLDNVEYIQKTVCDFGYNDSTLKLQNFLSEKNISLSEFIFNPKYIVIIDGDEYGIFEDFKRIFGEDRIIEEYGE